MRERERSMSDTEGDVMGDATVRPERSTVPERRQAGKVQRLGVVTMVALTLLTALVGGLRFARYDLAGTSFFATDEYYFFTTDDGRELDHLNIDIVSYLSMVEDFRGVDDAFYKAVPYPAFAETDDVPRGPTSPFIQRPILPFVASLLPFDSAVAFAAVNLGLVLVGLWCLVDALARQGRSRRAQLIGGLLYAVSLPMLVFASSLFIDGGTMGLFVVGYWLIVRRWWWALAIFLPVSYAVKESLIFLVPAAVVAWRASGRSWRDTAFVVGAPLIAVGWVAVAVVARLIAPEATYSFSVLPQGHFLVWNLTNPVSAVFFVVGSATVMLPALLCILILVRRGGWRGAFDLAGTEIAGVATLVAVNAYSLVSTDLTVRTAWLVWPFAIALTALLVDELTRDGTAGWPSVAEVRSLASSSAAT